MPFLDDLRRKGKSPTAILQKFRTVPRLPDCLYLFVEGYEDKEYFGSLLFSHGKAHEIVVCFGKGNLDRVLELFDNSGLQGRNVLFLRDRDFDELFECLPRSANLFVTCGYSVENYVSTPTALCQFLRTKCGVSDGEVDLGQIIADYVELVRRFAAVSEAFHARVLSAISLGQEVDLNGLDVERVAKALMVGSQVKAEKILGEFLDGRGIQPHASERGEGALKEIASSCPFVFLRGKYLLSICAIYLKRTLENLTLMHGEGKIVHFNRRAASISRDNVFSTLAPYAHPTTRLCGVLEISPHPCYPLTLAVT